MCFFETSISFCESFSRLSARCSATCRGSCTSAQSLLLGESYNSKAHLLGISFHELLHDSCCILGWWNCKNLVWKRKENLLIATMFHDESILFFSLNIPSISFRLRKINSILRQPKILTTNRVSGVVPPWYIGPSFLPSESDKLYEVLVFMCHSFS